MAEALHLNEHEAAKWLAKDELDSVDWLPADVKVVEALRSKLTYQRKDEAKDHRSNRFVQGLFDID